MPAPMLRLRTSTAGNGENVVPWSNSFRPQDSYCGGLPPTLPPVHQVVSLAPILGDVTAVFTNAVCLEGTVKDAASKVASVASRLGQASGSGTGALSTSRRLSHSPPVTEVASGDPQQVPEYAADIITMLKRTESCCFPDSEYMQKQPHINLEMRAILIDWLVDVHKKYKCKPNTLFLAVALTDRYLERRVIQRRHLQLVGIAGMLVAAKFEELFPPSVKDFVQVVDQLYSRDEICGMEVSMLTRLGFQVCQPTAFDFMDHFSRVNGCSDRQRHLAQYLLELALVRALHLQHLPSRLAAAAVAAASRLTGKEPAWESAAAQSSQFLRADLSDLGQSLTSLLSDAEAGVGKLQAVRKKFSSDKFLTVAKTRWTSPASTLPPASENERPASGAQSGLPPRPSATRRLSGLGCSAASLVPVQRSL